MSEGLKLYVPQSTFLRWLNGELPIMGEFAPHRDYNLMIVVNVNEWMVEPRLTTHGRIGGCIIGKRPQELDYCI